MTKHRPCVPEPARPVIEQVVLDHRPHDTGGVLRPQGQMFTIKRVFEGVHLLLDDIGDFTDAALEKRSRLDDRRANLPIAITASPSGHRMLESLPALHLLGQEIVHTLDTGQPCGRSSGSVILGAGHSVGHDQERSNRKGRCSKGFWKFWIRRYALKTRSWLNRRQNRHSVDGHSFRRWPGTPGQCDRP